MCKVSSVSMESEAGGGLCSAEPALGSSSAGGQGWGWAWTRHSPSPRRPPTPPPQSPTPRLPPRGLGVGGGGWAVGPLGATVPLGPLFANEDGCCPFSPFLTGCSFLQDV